MQVKIDIFFDIVDYFLLRRGRLVRADVKIAYAPTIPIVGGLTASNCVSRLRGNDGIGRANPAPTTAKKLRNVIIF